MLVIFTSSWRPPGAGAGNYDAALPCGSWTVIISKLYPQILSLFRPTVEDIITSFYLVSIYPVRAISVPRPSPPDDLYAGHNPITHILPRTPDISI